VDFTPHQVDQAREFVDYTFRKMARLCATYGWNGSRGQCVERLQADLTPAPLEYRRGMVVGRQLFFFSHAYRLTDEPIYREHANRLFEDLINNFWDHDHGGWYFSLSIDNNILDATKDLYSHALIMFGLAHYLAIFKDDKARQWLDQTQELVSNRLSLPGGWLAPAATREWAVLGRNLEQDAHMHLLEAHLSAYKATKDDAFLKSAAQMMSLYTEMLRTSDRSKILEHLDENARPSAANGTLIQSGHLYEWYWLVGEYADIAGLPEFKPSCAPMMEWADRWCLDADAGGIFDTVDTAGNVVSDRKRLWPVTERIKALTTVVRDGSTGRSREALAGWINFFLEKYGRSDGAWHEYLNRKLEPDCDYMPLSTPYHVAMAALEVERLFGGPGAFGMTNAKSPDFP
jgi:mannose/cellobiose epimerase-like protein (N-acyl-D-glucosamine 2-epimerase family)